MGFLWGRARLADIALREGKIGEARQTLVYVIENFHADQNRNGLAFALDRMASLMTLTGKLEAAAYLVGWSDANRQKFGDPRPQLEQADLERSIAAIKAKIGADAYDSAYNAGQILGLDEVAVIALGGG